MKKGYLTLTLQPIMDNVASRIVLQEHYTEDVPTLELLQSVVGGYIEPMFTVTSPCRKGYEITGYVNEEGLLINLPIFAGISVDGDVRPFAGNLVITALTRNGNTALLTEEEMQAVVKAYQRGIFHLDPLIKESA